MKGMVLKKLKILGTLTWTLWLQGLSQAQQKQAKRLQLLASGEKGRRHRDKLDHEVLLGVHPIPEGPKYANMGQCVSYTRNSYLKDHMNHKTGAICLIML